MRRTKTKRTRKSNIGRFARKEAELIERGEVSDRNKCAVCGKRAEFSAELSGDIQVTKLGEAECSRSPSHGVLLCCGCALRLYKRLGEQFVPKAIPNVVLRAQKIRTAEFAIGKTAQAEE